MKKISLRRKILLAIAVAAPALYIMAAAAGCSVGYVVHAGIGQFDIMRSTKPVDQVLAAPDTDAEVREKLEIILEAKAYGERVIGLKHTDAYTTYADLDRPVAVWNLMAAPPLKLQPVTWWFPIVGRMPYLGYFDKARAEKKERSLQEKGYETYLRGASAYSTLGWFKDPIFSPILRYDIPTLVNVTIHEMTHTTVFLEGHVAYNEGMALFVGNQGSIDFLTEKYGADHEYVRIEKDDIHNDRVFSVFLRGLRDRLEKLYNSDMTDEEKLREKEKILAEAKDEFDALPFHGQAYTSFRDRELNNAAILSRAIYVVDMDMYERLYETLGRDLKKMVRFFLDVENKKVDNPEEYTRNYIKQHLPKKVD